MKTIILLAWSLVMTSVSSWGQAHSSVSGAEPSKTVTIRAAAHSQQIRKQVSAGRLAPRQATVLSDPLPAGWNPANISSVNQVYGEQVLAPLKPSTVPVSLRPKVAYVGHVQIYSPIMTAVARKNPLCLFDSKALSISF